MAWHGQYTRDCAEVNQVGGVNAGVDAGVNVVVNVEVNVGVDVAVKENRGGSMRPGVFAVP